MKYCVFSIIFIGLAFTVKAQSNVNPHYDYHQNIFLDSLRNAHKQPAVIIIPSTQIVYNMPVATLSNRDEIVGKSGNDTIYQMKTDKMLLLKPDASTTKILNSMEGK